jgi:hypothetical protein
MLAVTKVTRRDPLEVAIMETLLIDLGALGVFLGYMAIVCWHGVSHEAQRHGRRVSDVSRDT